MSDTTTKTARAQLQDYVDAHGWAQTAESIGCHKAAMSPWLRGARAPNYRIRKRIEAVTGIPIASWGPYRAHKTVLKGPPSLAQTMLAAHPYGAVHDATGAAHQTIHGWLSGHYIPIWETRLKLEQKFGIPTIGWDAPHG